MKEELERILFCIEKVGGEVKPLVFEQIATENDLVEIERELEYKIPIEFRNILLKESSHLEFRWLLNDDFELPAEFNQNFSGEIHWGIKFILSFNKSKDEWVEKCFPNPLDEYDKVWHNKFVFQEVGNGDYLSIDLSNENNGKIIYLSHDDGEGHGYVMANSFNELLDNWLGLGCPGGEDWQWLPFTQNKASGINLNCKNAIAWKKLVGLS